MTQINKQKLVRILKNNNVAKAGLFGSQAKGTAKKNSDVDLLISFRGSKSLLDLIGLKQELEDSFKKKFDVITYKSIHPLLRDSILKEEVKII